MTPTEQEQFAAYMRAHVQKPPGAKYHQPMTIFTDLAAEILGRNVHHWRDLSLEDARTVMRAVKRKNAA